MCFGCCETIPIGSSVGYTVSVDGSDLSAAYWCNKCQIIINDQPYGTFEDGIDEGQIKEMFPEKFKTKVEE